MVTISCLTSGMIWPCSMAVHDAAKRQACELQCSSHCGEAGAGLLSLSSQRCPLSTECVMRMHAHTSCQTCSKLTWLSSRAVHDVADSQGIKVWPVRHYDRATVMLTEAWRHFRSGLPGCRGCSKVAEEVVRLEGEAASD